MHLRSLCCHSVHYCAFCFFRLLFWWFLGFEQSYTLLFLDMEVKRGFRQLICFAVKDEKAGDNVSLEVQLQKHENLFEAASFFLDESLVFERTQNSFLMAKIPGLKNADVLNNVFSTVLTTSTCMLSNQVPPWG